MRSMTFLVNDRSSVNGGPAPTVAVTITENADGSVSFSLRVIGPVTGDLRGFFFDVANESLIGSLSVTPTSSGLTEFRQGNDSIRDLGQGANMNGLLGSDGGYDAGVEIGTAGDSRDDYQSFSFTVSSSAGALTLDDFANVDIGVRVNSVGTEWFCDERDGEAKLLERTGRAMDAIDDAGAIAEDAVPGQIIGNVFGNDLNLNPVHLISAVNGSAGNVGDEIQGAYGTLRLHLNGSYTYRLDSAAAQALAAGQLVVESFTYTAKNFDELTSFSTDSAVLRITITGTNDAPTITAAVEAGAVTELADNAPGESVALHSAAGSVDFSDVDLTDSHTVSVAAAAAGYVGALSAAVSDPSTGDGAGEVSWTFEVADGAIEHLGAGETLTQSYTLTVDDGHGGLATQDVTITITGSNDAPVIAAAAAAGAVTELADNAPGEGALVHSTSDSFNFSDLDLSDEHAVSVTAAGDDYLGELTAEVSDAATGDGSGEVSWNFEVSDGAIEHLGAGDSLTQTYTLAVDDGNGGTATQDVTVTITGANDAPEIDAAASDTSGSVFEDGSRRDSGQIVAQDVDLGDTLTWSVDGNGPDTPRADYRYLLDNLNIVRNGALFFNDDFGNGVPPPSAPAFTYFTSGSFLESGGRTIMDGGLGVPFTIPTPGAPTVIVHTATLATDNNSLDVTQGLKRAHDFRVEARYDLVLPEEELSTYTLRLTDSANDIVSLDVRRMEDGSLAVALREVDTANTIPVVRAAIPLAPAAGDNQIVLRLEHAAGSDLITASFDLLSGGVLTHTETFATPASIFSNESWTRAQVIGQAPAVPLNGTYGTLSVDASGEWSYALNNRAANVQALAQGEHVTDTFTVTVQDQHGAFDTQTVAIDVAGSNDAPVITSGSGGSFLVEDAIIGVGAQFSATDVDHGADLTWSVGPDFTILTPVPGPINALGYRTDYRFALDQLKVERNGVTIFEDQFSDGLAPPSAPSFNGFPFNYFAAGVYQEFSDRVFLDGFVPAAQRGINNPNLTVGHLAVLNTNADPNDLTRGLKSDDDFTIEARYDLALPAAGTVYGITLTDNSANGVPQDQLGDSNMSLLVRRDADGNLIVQLNDFDVVTDQGVTREVLPLGNLPDDSQIVLRLIHDKDHVGIVRAEFDLVGPGGTRTYQFTEVAHTFGAATPDYAGDDENWTRVQLVAFGPDLFATNNSAEGLYGTFTLDPVPGTDTITNWHYTLDPVRSQWLAQGETVQEVFPVRVVDEHGLSTSGTQTINVSGTNDPVTFGGGITSGEVEEDGNLFASGNILFSDVDLIDVHTAVMLAGPFSPLGQFSLGPVVEAPFSTEGSLSWNYTLDNDAAQSLAAGQSVTEVYTFRVQDSFGGFITQDVFITIHGAEEPNDAPVAADASYIAFEDASLFALLFASDDDGDTLTFELASAPQHGSVEVGPGGHFLYVPDENFSGIDTFEYRVSDGRGGVDIGSVGLNVSAIADVPTLLGGDLTTDENVPVALNLFAALNDNDGSESLTISIFGVPVGASLSAGTDQGGGIWSLTADQLPGLMFNPAPDSEEDVTLTVSAIATEASNGNQAFDSRNISITVNPVEVENTPPEIVGQTTGQVYEDSVRVAQGQLTALDPDPGATAAWSVTSPSTLGSATIDAFGRWTYTLNDTLFQVQQLAQNQVALDTFMVQASDGLGGTDTQQVQVQITGTNDRPFMQPLPPVTTNEDAPPITGQAIGGDVDSGAALTWSVSRLSNFGYSADYLFSMERFSITKNGVLIFDDGFDNGVPPPQAPNFSNGQPVTYAATNGSFAETFGDLLLPGSLAINFGGAGFNGLLVGESALLNTDTNQADTVSGLKINHDFTIEGVFDLTLPDAPREGYGLQLSDSVPGPLGVGRLGDDQLSLVVRPNNLTGLLSVELIDSNATTDTATLPGSVLLNPVGADQIRLRFTHDADTPGLINAEFEYLSGGIVTGPAIAVGSARIFGTDTPALSNDEAFTRAGLQAFGLDQFANVTTLAGAYGTLHVNNSGQWDYTVNASAQSLAQGQSVVDSFHLRLTDEFGLSSSQPLNITVQGANDAPIGGDDFFFDVGEDDSVALTVLGNDLDVDTGAVLHVGNVSGPFGPNVSFLGASVTINPNGTVQYDASTSAQLQALNAGAMMTDSFTYTVLDEHGAQGSATVFVQVHGANEGPTEPADGTVFEDGIRRATGDLDLAGGEQVASVTGTGVGTLRADYRGALDNLNIVRVIPGGPSLTAITDDFANNNPGLSSGNVSWSLFGSYIETNGRLAMDGGLGVLSTTPGVANVLVHTATLLTDAGPDATQGLKRAQTFIAEARFDLSIPDEALESYGLRLTDNSNDIIEVALRRMDDGELAVVLREADATNVLLTELTRINLDTADGDSQIVLRMFHSANSFTVNASFDVLNDQGLVTQSGAFLPSTPPDIFTGEDWTRVQVLSFGPAEPQNGRYGTLSVDADGDWSYQLANADPNVQALAQGETAVDSFTVTVNDGMGGTRTEEVSVEVVGSNDQPIIQIGLSAVGGAFVVENGRQAAGGFGFATDVDHAADIAWSVRPLIGSPYTTSYNITLDELSITRNGALHFQDTFSDGVAPTLANAPAGYPYLPSGGFSESGDRLVLNGQLAAGQRGTGFDQLMAGHLLSVGGVVRPDDDTLGLRIDDNFEVSARFDIASLQPGQSYGFSLTDNTFAGVPQDQLGDDVISVEVANVGGTVVVRFVERDVVADTLTELGAPIVLNAGSSTQIELKLSHSALNPGQVTASFDLLNGLGPTALSGTGQIFDGEDWTRVQVIAIGPDQNPLSTSAQGTYGMMTVDAETGAWNYVVNNPAAMEALNHNQVVNDNFNFRVTDQYGVSTFRTMGVTVLGTGDPAPTGPFTFPGNPGNETVVGTNQDDTFFGSAGADFMVGLGGADRFDYNNLNEGGDGIADFTPGAGGDILDLQTLLATLPGYIPGVNAADYVRVFGSSVNGQQQTQILIDADGIMGPGPATSFVNLYDTNQTYDSLLAGGNLIV